MAIAEYKQTIETTSATNDSGVPFVEHPSQLLRDNERDEFLRLIEDDSEPNDVLCTAAARYKSRKS